MTAKPKPSEETPLKYRDNDAAIALARELIPQDGMRLRAQLAHNQGSAGHASKAFSEGTAKETTTRLWLVEEGGGAGGLCGMRRKSHRDIVLRRDLAGVRAFPPSRNTVVLDSVQ
ncbi:hypothetical protein GQ53DRAFT_744851 [Thozetella sp. PMI_491]|nr:hypothetical protein GQ53DRAFT_744851 [Thozetella sp. PMI_491]